MKLQTKCNLAWLWSLLLLGLPALMTVFTSRLSDPDDDWGIAMLIAGRYDATLCLYINPVLFWALAIPARVLEINAYGLFQMAATLAAFAALALAFFRRMERPVAAAMFSLLVFCYWHNSMVAYNYTYNAALCAWAGILLLDLFGRELAGRWAAVCGALLWWLGFLWRKESALLSLPFAGLYLAYMLWKNRSDWRGAAKRILPWLGLVLGLAGASFALERALWSAPEWAEYADWNQARTAIVDYNTAPWSEAKENLEPLGISENDYWCANNWIFADPEFFTLERMQAMADQKVNPDVGELVHLVGSYFLRLPFEVRSCLVFLLFCVACLVLGGPLEWLVALCAGLGGLACSAYFMWAGRCQNGLLLPRVADVIWLSGICCVVMLLQNKTVCTKKWFRLAGYAAAVLFLAYNGVRILPWMQLPDWMTGAPKVQGEAVANILERQDAYYLWDVNGAASYLNGAYDNSRLPEEEFDRFNGTLGSWVEHAPYLQEFRQQLGIANPMRALVEQQDVYLVDNLNPQRILTYVQEHYQRQAALSAAVELEEGLWALKITPPLCAQAQQPLEWAVRSDGQPEQDGAQGWCLVSGQAAGLPQDAVLWLCLSDESGTKRCFRLIQQQDGFSGALYLEGINTEAMLTARLMWQQPGGELVESDSTVALQLM